MAMNFEPPECVIFVQSTKIGTNENKAIHSTRHPLPYLSWGLYSYRCSEIILNSWLCRTDRQMYNKAPLTISFPRTLFIQMLRKNSKYIFRSVEQTDRQTYTHTTHPFKLFFPSTLFIQMLRKNSQPSALSNRQTDTQGIPYHIFP